MVHTPTIFAALLSLSTLAHAQDAVTLPPFDPRSYTKQFATCNARERGAIGSGTPIKIKLGYVDVNPSARKTLVMVHGWPSLWTTYRHQITGLPKEYRLLVVENRGYGESEHPKDLGNSNSMPDVSSIFSNPGIRATKKKC